MGLHYERDEFAKQTCPSCWGHKSEGCQECEETGLVPEIQISRNFLLSELVNSVTARELKISNFPGLEAQSNLIESTLLCFQKARDILKQPMIVTSGYRSFSLNKAVGGVLHSAHSHGRAIDFVLKDRRPETLYTAAQILRHELDKFDQIILEFDNLGEPVWIHLGWKNLGGEQRKQALIFNKGEYSPLPY